MKGRSSPASPATSDPALDTRRNWLGYLTAFSAFSFNKRAVAADEAATRDRYSHVPPGAGTNYNWGSDHLFVKVPGTTTGGAYNLIEDNLQATFALGLHLHRKHAETFYIVSGSVDFYVVDDWITVKEGGTLHIPPGTPHAAAATHGVKRLA